jgi:pyroglutamyl-peptidase
MGSEGGGASAASAAAAVGGAGGSLIEFNITGFKKFHGVAENPTEIILGRIEEYLRIHGMPAGTVLGSCTVLEAAGEGALLPLMQLLHSSSSSSSSSQSLMKRRPWIDRHWIQRDANWQEGGDHHHLNARSASIPQKQIVWVHFGVNSAATNFALEWCAVNEATFRCSDELGWQPQRVPIVAEDGPISHIRETTIPVRDVVTVLRMNGYDVMESYDAGRFVCNYVYYQSLRHSAAYGNRSIFVHVPLFIMIDEEHQLQFVAALLHALAFRLL